MQTAGPLHQHKPRLHDGIHLACHSSNLWHNCSTMHHDLYGTAGQTSNAPQADLPRLLYAWYVNFRSILGMHDETSSHLPDRVGGSTFPLSLLRHRIKTSQLVAVRTSHHRLLHRQNSCSANTTSPIMARLHPCILFLGLLRYGCTSSRHNHPPESQEHESCDKIQAGRWGVLEIQMAGNSQAHVGIRRTSGFESIQLKLWFSPGFLACSRSVQAYERFIRFYEHWRCHGS